MAGGGPAGAVAALVLARAGHRVVLLDDGGQSPPRAAPPARPAFKIGEFLPPAVRPLLGDLGLLDAFLASGHPVSTGTYAAWGSEALHGRSHLFDPYGHGWHLDRPRFDAFLRDTAVEAGAELRQATALERIDDRLIVRERAGAAVAELSARWTVDATGRRCVIGRRSGHRRRQDRLVAAYAVFPDRHPSSPAQPAGPQDAEARTLVEAAPHGWWYTTRIPAGRLVAHLTDADLADPSLRTPQGFWQALSRTVHVRRRLTGHGPAATPVPRWAPAHGLRLTPAAGPGWVAAGDAALAFDPLSSQGILTALHTGARAGRAVADCLADGGRTRTSLADYTAFLDGIAAAYQRSHAYAYDQERRWPLNPFWRRRRTADGLAAASTADRPTATEPRYAAARADRKNPVSFSAAAPTYGSRS
ncbi:tryptophan 7-halogenase [Kitasatospora brasiliensis]|uniref:tryptophan 7-halogenase n=1 Tax=Kitasatospora brasiliensis TaxID=3058040 RepID=UPI00292EB973|nr:tryptophan 7-halogenase [Kitasatospora sp. K002]